MLDGARDTPLLPKPRHETHLISARPILLTLAAFGLISLGALSLLYFFYRRYPEPPPLPRDATAALLPDAAFDRLQEEERERLQAYGWVDREAGIAHVPVDRAIDLVLRRYAREKASSATTGDEQP